jgi:hypothetical protein
MAFSLKERNERCHNKALKVNKMDECNEECGHRSSDA